MRCRLVSCGGVVTGTSAFDFGVAAQGSKLSKAARTFRVANDGNANLAIGKMTLPVGFVILSGLPALMTQVKPPT